MNEDEILNRIEEVVKNELQADSTGHDWFHIERVRKIAVRILKTETEANRFIVEASALLHDIADHKFYDGDETVGPEKAREILDGFGISREIIDSIAKIIEEISYKGAGVPTPMSTKEGMIVQDADRLDAIGAIGIARTFAYGGSKGRTIYNPNIVAVCHTSFAAYKTSTAPTLNHFYEKLLLLKDLMNTEKGKKIADSRHRFMEEFLSQFYLEWDGRDA